MKDFLSLFPIQVSLQNQSENASWLIAMMQLKVVLDKYSEHLSILNAVLKDKKVKKGPIRKLLGLSKTSIYRKLADVSQFSYEELHQISPYLGLSTEPVSDYLDMLSQLNEIIRRSKWKKQRLMEALHIPPSRSALLTRNPSAWRLEEVYRLVDMLSTTDDI